jgi:peptide/nickel transport system permease protein
MSTSAEHTEPDLSQLAKTADGGDPGWDLGVSDAAFESPGRRAVRRFFRHRLATFGLAVIIVMALMAIFASHITRYPPSQTDLTRYRKPPNAANWMGTDTLGRDVFTRLIYAGRVSLSVGLIAVGIYEAIAVVLGSISGYYGGRVDWVIMRAVDVVMTIPTMIIIIFMVTILGPSAFNTMLAIGLMGWTGPTRLVRGQILSLREMDYVTAARSLGSSDARIIVRHVFPGVVAPLLVHATFGVASAILLEAALSFLNLGVQPPTPTWGNMLSDAQSLVILESMPWLWVPPGLAIMVAVLAINFIGDGLRDALDPRGMVEGR